MYVVQQICRARILRRQRRHVERDEVGTARVHHYVLQEICRARDLRRQPRHVERDDEAETDGAIELCSKDEESHFLFDTYSRYALLCG